MHSILVVEDNSDLLEYVRELLLDQNFSVITAENGSLALQKLEKSPPDLVILDLGLPDIDGETVCMEIRKRFPAIPIIILTARDDTADVVKVLNLGADDYISKPFAGEELLARIRARLRRDGEEDTKLKVADLEIDTNSLEVKRNGKLIKLTPKELQLLQYLMNNKGRVLHREIILNRVWMYSPDIESRAVDVYIGYLRKKIDSGYKKKLLHCVRGYGYVIKD